MSTKGLLDGLATLPNELIIKIMRETYPPEAFTQETKLARGSYRLDRELWASWEDTRDADARMAAIAEHGPTLHACSMHILEQLASVFVDLGRPNAPVVFKTWQDLIRLRKHCSFVTGILKMEYALLYQD